MASVDLFEARNVYQRETSDQQPVVDLACLQDSLEALRSYVQHEAAYWHEAGHANRWHKTVNACLAARLPLMDGRAIADELHGPMSYAVITEPRTYLDVRKPRSERTGDEVAVPSANITVAVPIDMLGQIDAAAERSGLSRGNTFRELLICGLEVWP